MVIDIDKIESVERADDLSCKVWINGKSLKVDYYPFTTFIQLLEDKIAKRQEEEGKEKQKEKTINQFEQHWAG